MDRYSQQYQIQRHLHLKRFFSNSYNELVIADTFRLLALSMISIFVPIYLIEQLQISILWVAIYQLGFYFISILLHFYFIPASGSIGAKKILVASYLLNIVLFIILFFGKDILFHVGIYWFAFLLALFSAIPTSMYWSSHHLYFLKCTRIIDEGKKLGILEGIPIIFSIAGPFIGGVLISVWDYRAVFLFSILFLALASINLFFSKDIKANTKINLKRSIDSKNLKKNLIFILQGSAYAVTSVFWPILLFVSSITIVSMGIFYLFSNIANALIVYTIGKSADSKKAYNLSRIGSIGHGLSMIFRAISITPVFMALSHMLGGLFGGMWLIVINTEFYKHSHRDMGNKVMNRELYMHIGRIMAVLVFLVSYFLYGPYVSLVFIMIFGGIMTCLASLLIDKKNIL